jgi:hypothetical protein
MKTYYPGKIARPLSITLTPTARRILRNIRRRTRRSRSDIVEHLLRLYGEQLVFEPPAPTHTSSANGNSRQVTSESKNG